MTGDQEINVGTIVSQTLEVVQENLKPVAIFMIAMVALGVVSELLGSGANIGYSIGSIIATYVLVEEMTKQRGLFTTDRARRYLPYVGMSILTGLGIGLGIVLLVIPGLIVAARWSLTGPLLIGRGQGVIESMGKSWEMTRPYVLPIILAGLLMAIAFILLVFVSIAFLDESSVVAMVIGQIGGNGIAVLSAALGVGLLGLIDPSNDQLTDVFA